MPAPSRSNVLKIVCWLVILAAAVTLYKALPVNQAVEALKQWVESLGPWGPVAFGLIYILCCVVTIPASLLTLAAGAIFGLGIGTVVVSISSVIGATLAFLIGRYLASGWVESKTKNSPKFKAVLEAVEEGGWKVVGMLRLSPAVPFVYQNYLLGITPVKLLTYVVTSWVAMLPGTFMYVYLGAAGGKAASGGASAGQWALLIVGLLATIALTVYLTHVAKQKLKETPAEDGDGDGEGEGDADADASDDDQPDSDSSSPDDDMTHDSDKSASGLGWKLPAAAVLAAALAGCAVVGGESLSQLFGPPPVEMKETYAANNAEPVVDHSAFDALLKDHVDAAGLVDYEGLIGRQDELDAYLATLEAAPFSALGRDEKLALLINAYNAFTLRLMTEHPGIDSITSIPEADRWKAERWNVAGQTTSLFKIENELIRPNFIEPRIHWALVCAAVGCPPLRTEAYVGGKLEAQLDSQARKVFTRGTKWYEVSDDQKQISVTPIMQWYQGDFKQTRGGVAPYVALYDGTVGELINAGTPPKVKFLDYDWALNEQKAEGEGSGGGGGGGGGEGAGQ